MSRARDQVRVSNSVGVKVFKYCGVCISVKVMDRIRYNVRVQIPEC